MPEIVVITDYDKFFEAWVRSMLKDKLAKGHTIKHKRIEINAGPWRQSVVSFVEEGDTLKLDFYSAYRTGFGELPDDERAALQDLL